MSNTKTEASRLADAIREDMREWFDGSTRFLMPIARGMSIITALCRLETAHTVAVELAAQYAAERDQLRAQLAEAVASKRELLEALELMEKAQAHIDGLPMFPTTHATEGARFKLFDARQAARASIAKATGEHHD